MRYAFDRMKLDAGSANSLSLNITFRKDNQDIEDNITERKERHDTKGYTRDVSFLIVVSFTALNNVIMQQSV